MTLPRIDFGVNYGAIATLKFKTIITRKGEGSEQRISKWRKFLLDFQVGDRTLDKAELEVLQNFIATVRGKFNVFRFKNWLDFKAVNQAIGTGSGTVFKFQLTKTYGFTNPLTIDINLPVRDTLFITVAGLNNTNWTCNWETGVVTFRIAPIGAIVATFEFDALCSLSVDATSHLFEAFEKSTGERFFKTGQITARQERIDPIELIPTKWLCDNGVCLPDIDGIEGIYGTQTECENTIIRPIFTGGQCTGSYQLNISAKFTYDVIGAVIVSNSITHDGPVSTVRSQRNIQGDGNSSPTLAGDNKIFVTFAGTERLAISSNAGQRCTNIEIIQFNLVPLGGNLDNCGNFPNSCPILLSPDTYIVPFISLTSLSAPTIAAITSAIAGLRDLLKNPIYNGDGALANKYVKDPIGTETEAYMLWTVENDYRDDILTEPKKFLFLLFVNEANLIDTRPSYPLNRTPPTSTFNSYHGFLNRVLEIEPSMAWLAHFDILQAAYPSFVKYDVLIFSPTGTPPNSEVNVFNAHIVDVIEGNNGYPAMKNYNWNARPNWNENATAQDYLDEIIEFLQ